MSNNDRYVTQLDDYVIDLFAQEDDALRWIQAETNRNEMPQISIRAHEGRLLQFLMRAVDAKKVIEVGALAGYSGVWLARALPAGGRLFSLEKSSKHAQVARASFERAGVADRVQLIEGSALDSLKKLTVQGPFDFMFIDADKASYINYLAWGIENIRPGGMITAHNAYRDGKVIAPESDDDKGMAAFNEALARDPRLDATIIGVGDGMAVALRKA